MAVGGQTPTTQFIRRYTGYVEQFDTLIAALTVRSGPLYFDFVFRPPEKWYYASLVVGGNGNGA